MMGQKYTFEKEVKRSNSIPIPEWIDLRADGNFPNILDKGVLSCNSVHAVSNVMRFWLRKLNKQEFQPSRLFMYYFARLLEDKIYAEEEVSLESVFRVISEIGVCSEKDFPYDVEKVFEEPSLECQQLATKHCNKLKYFSVRNKTKSIKEAVSYGYPIVFNMKVFEGFHSEDAVKTGIISMPSKKENPVGSGIYIILGFRNSSESFICANCEGKEYGEKGFFYLPFEYVDKYGSSLYAVFFFV